jgi:hypothetical protein
VGIESSLQVAEEGITISPLLDSHQTVRVMIPSKEAQSVLSHELQGLVDQKYEGQSGGFDRSKEMSTLISSSTSPRVFISVSSIMIEAFEPSDEYDVSHDLKMANVDPDVDMNDDDCKGDSLDDEEPANGIRISLLLPESSKDDDCRTEYKFTFVTIGNDVDSLVVFTKTDTSINELGIVAKRESDVDVAVDVVVVCRFFIITE